MMFTVVALFTLLLGIVTSDGMLELASGLFAIAGAIEYVAYKIYQNKTN